MKHPHVHPSIQPQPLLLPDTLGLILHYLSKKSDHLALRLVCRSLARVVCTESNSLWFHLETVDQLDVLKQSPFVGMCERERAS